MKNRRRRVITAESRSQTIIWRNCNRFQFRCDVCGSESVSILPEGVTDEQLRDFETELRSGICADDECRLLLEGETLSEILINKERGEDETQ